MALNPLGIDSEQKMLIGYPIRVPDGTYITRAKTITWLLRVSARVSRWEPKSAFGRPDSIQLKRCSIVTEVERTASTRLSRACLWLVDSVSGVCSPPLLTRVPHLSWLIIIDRFPITTAARTAKTGLAFGLAYGLVQDALSCVKGRPPAYVNFILRRGRSPREIEQMEQSGVV